MTRYCDNCDKPVGDDFYRVFSSNDGKLFGCPKCRTSRELFSGVTVKG